MNRLARFIAGSLLLAFAQFAPSNLYAACTSPAAAAGSLNWNSGTSVFQYCDGTTWQNFSGVNSGTSGQLTYYASTGAAVSGNANLTVSSGALTIGVAGTQAGTLKISGATTGTTTLAVAASASGTLTLPSATDTLIGKATTDTLTNKTFDTAGTGNSFSINGTAVTAVTGTGAVVLASSPTVTTPTFTTSATVPLVIGGTGASSTLTLESTSGTGTSDAMIFKTGSQAEAMRITTGGLVGIGTTTPSNLGSGLTTNVLHVHKPSGAAQLSLSGDATTNGTYVGELTFGTMGASSSNKMSAAIVSTLTASSATNATGDLQFYTANGAGVAQQMEISAAGNVGIGTSSPSVRLGQKLDVATTANYGGMALSTWSAGASDHSSILDFNRSKSSTFGTYTAVASGDNLGNINFRGSDGTSFVNSSVIHGFVDGTVATNQVPGRLMFDTANSSGTLTERMRIDSSGNVGIGTATVSAPLHLYNSQNALTRVRLQNPNAGNAAGVSIDIYTDQGIAGALFANSSAYTGYGGVNSVNLINVLAGPLAFSTSNAVRMTLDSSGNLGIGTTTIGQKLTVNGNVSLVNGTSNTIFYGTNGVAAPGSNSAGEKIQLYGTAGTVGASDYALGIEGSNFWFNSGSAYKWYSASSQKMVLDSGGSLGIGTATPGAKLHTYASSGSGQIKLSENNGFSRLIYFTNNTADLYFWDGASNFPYLSAAGAWTNASDIHTKKDIVKMHTYGLDTVMVMNPVEYRMKDTGEKQVGFIAQEMKKVVPEVVGGVEGKMGLSYGNLVAVVVKAVQELKADNDNLRREVQELRREIHAH